ncbi:hypothetical protein EYE40_13260 [Glaciihabitans arcticus]|uniref:Uncharacterized protein n=1 Tax=Glaciihabitans arcticus TaxID=2668039 RepID=A0A4Q9GU91_9MICO|nr:hypothetical protein [Glaciihabitans arcticus]TBN58285.1 hypothetical protein EYE40_13260 [Glaciihabitans arcticus]
MTRSRLPFAATIARGMTLGAFVGVFAMFLGGALVILLAGVLTIAVSSAVGAISALGVLIALRLWPSTPRTSAAVGAVLGSLSIVPLCALALPASWLPWLAIVAAPICAGIAVNQLSIPPLRRSARSAAGWWLLIVGHAATLGVLGLLVPFLFYTSLHDESVTLTPDYFMFAMAGLALLAAAVLTAGLTLLRPWRSRPESGRSVAPVGLGIGNLVVAAPIAAVWLVQAIGRLVT